MIKNFRVRATELQLTAINDDWVPKIYSRSLDGAPLGNLIVFPRHHSVLRRKVLNAILTPEGVPHSVCLSGKPALQFVQALIGGKQTGVTTLAWRLGWRQYHAATMWCTDTVLASDCHAQFGRSSTRDGMSHLCDSAVAGLAVRR